ncbi:hypothetical protein C8Q75DRAFT_576970 [Abortiporus biennis]|nr:hypothetical protein C8Q75DRAFT_576970 [Abortiporus biennis]
MMTANKAFIALDVALVAFCVYDTLRRRDLEKKRSRQCDEGCRESEERVKLSASRDHVGQPLGSSQEPSLTSCSTSTLDKVGPQSLKRRRSVNNPSLIHQQDGASQDVSIVQDDKSSCQPFSETARVINVFCRSPPELERVEPSFQMADKMAYYIPPIPLLSPLPRFGWFDEPSTSNIFTLPPLQLSPPLSATIFFEHFEEQANPESGLSTLPPLPPSPPPSTSPSFEEKSVVDLDLSCLPPLPPSPLLSESTSFEHLEEQAGFELDLSTLPPLPLSPTLSPSQSFELSEEQGGLDLDLSMLPPLPLSPLLSLSPSFEEKSTRVNLDLSLDLGAIEEWVVIDLTPEEKEEIVDAKDNEEDVLEQIPAEEESSSLLEDRSFPALFEEEQTLVQDGNISEAKIEIAVQFEVTSVVEFLETVALVPSASLHEFERPAESEMKIPSSTSSPSKLGLYLRNVDFGASDVASSAAEIEGSKVASTGVQPEATKKTPAPRHKRAKRGGKNQRRPGKPSTSDVIVSVAGTNTDVTTASPQARPSGSHKHQSTGSSAKASNRSSTPLPPALVARPSTHSSIPPKPKTACPMHKVTPGQNNGPSTPLSGGVKLGVLTERTNSQEQKASGPRRGNRSRKPRASS